MKNWQGDNFMIYIQYPILSTFFLMYKTNFSIYRLEFERIDILEGQMDNLLILSLTWHAQLCKLVCKSVALISDKNLEELGKSTLAYFLEI